MHAESHEQQRGPAVDRRRAHDSAAPGRARAGGDGGVERGFQDVAGDGGDVRVGAVEVGLARRHGKVAVERQRLRVAGDQRVAQPRGKGTGRGAESVRRGRDVGMQGAERLGGEVPHLAGGAEAGAHLGELAGDLGGLDSGLGVFGA